MTFEDTNAPLIGHIYAAIETEYWDQAVLDRYGIIAAFGIYAVAVDDEETSDNLCICFLYGPDVPMETRANAECDLEFEGTLEPSYPARSSIAKKDARFIIAVYEDPGWDDSDREGDNWRMDALHEAWHDGGECELPILQDAVFQSYQDDLTAHRRSRNYPPIANWGANGLDNLPLFVHAAQPILAERLPRAERLATRVGDCAAGRWQRKPIEALNWSWPLPDPTFHTSEVTP